MSGPTFRHAPEKRVVRAWGGCLKAKGQGRGKGLFARYGQTEISFLFYKTLFLSGPLLKRIATLVKGTGDAVSPVDDLFSIFASPSPSLASRVL